MDYFARSSQPRVVTDCFRALFRNFMPDRIVELGTGKGGFTCWLARAAPAATIYTYDNQSSLRWDPTLAVPGNVVATRGSIWDREAEIKSLVSDPEARTLLLCDNGDKVREFRAFAPHVAAGNLVLVHDYWPDREDFLARIRGRIWNSCEIVDSDIVDTLETNDLMPFHSGLMQRAMWGCWIRRVEKEEVTIDTCRYRDEVGVQEGHELARCGFLVALTASSSSDLSRVTRDQCAACCESFPPSPGHPNPVLASLLYDRLRRQESGGNLRLQELVQKHLAIDGDGAAQESFAAYRGKTVADVIPVPQTQYGAPVREWSVGVTTSPRSCPVLERCLRHLNIAGWPRPHLFVDAPVRIPDGYKHLPRTQRDSAVGAWPNYYLSLAEMYLRQPVADAYMILQDDALLAPRADLRAYLERVLWPSASPTIVSLYCAGPDTQPEFGWTRQVGWNYGALALVFPRVVVQRFIADRGVLAHRLQEGDLGLTGIPDAIDAWARQRGIAFHFPTPSLVQHIGDASTLWNSNGLSEPQRRAVTDFPG